MATLDISITNSALPQIQGEIGATGTEGTWISTGYLMSEIVMIPLAAWLTRVFGLRKFLLVNAVLFSGFSMMCGLSHSLRADDHRPHRPGIRRRRHDPDRADHRAHAPAAPSDAHRHDHVRPDRAARSAARARGRRLARGEHRLELVLLHQSAGVRRAASCCSRRAARRQGPLGRIHQGRLARHCGARHRPELAHRGAGRGAARALVRLPHDHLAERARRGRHRR